MLEMFLMYPFEETSEEGFAEKNVLGVEGLAWSIWQSWLCNVYFSLIIKCRKLIARNPTL